MLGVKHHMTLQCQSCQEEAKILILRLDFEQIFLADWEVFRSFLLIAYVGNIGHTIIINQET